MSSTSVLSPEVRAALDEALAMTPPAPEATRFPQEQFPGLRVSFTPKVDDRQAKALAKVFQAVQWPRQTPMASQLTPAQREVAEALADVFVDVGEDNDAIPAQRAIRRRWLGLDAPTALERPMVGTMPVWLLLAEGRPLPEGLTVFERVQLACDVLRNAYGLSSCGSDVVAGLDDAIDDAVSDAAFRAELCTFISAVADDVVTAFKTPSLWVERDREDTVPFGLGRFLTRTLARCGVVIDGERLSLLRFSAQQLDDASLVAAAIAPAARARAIVDAAAPLFANDRVSVLIHLVKDHVSDAVVDAIFDAFNDAELTRPRSPLYAALRDAVASTPCPSQSRCAVERR